MKVKSKHSLRNCLSGNAPCNEARRFPHRKISTIAYAVLNKIISSGGQLELIIFIISLFHAKAEISPYNKLTFVHICNTGDLSVQQFLSED